METRSRVAAAAAWLGLAALVLYGLGPASIHVGLASPFIGFRVFTLGILLALPALLLGLVGLWLTRSAAAIGGRGRAVSGVWLGLLVLGITLLAAGAARDVPMINDITTDTEDPPAFVAAARLEANAGRDLGYPGPEFALQQEEGYPDLKPIQLVVPPAEAFAHARRAAAELGWEITAEDSDAGRIEAVDVTRVFRFADDVVIRIRPAAGGSRVDVRSKSRDGRGDLGTNAARIRAFHSELAGG